MATVSRSLPERPHLEIPKREARELLEQWRRGEPAALERIHRQHPKFKDADAAARAGAAIRLSAAQYVIAREYGFANWSALKHRIEASTVAHELRRAIHQGDNETVVRILQTNPALLHLPVWSGNWGPPMSHAANLGRLEIVQAVAALGGRDFQHAFDRAILQGQIETARWLHSQGARLVPGIVMGACETLNVSGFKFLLDLGAPLTNAAGNPLAPLAMVLETYARNPGSKHAILDLLGQRGINLPDTPIMAFHRGDLGRLREHVRRDSKLIERRFSLREIYPAECGCLNAGRDGLHWTPIEGTTLLHLAIDFGETEIFDWLLEQGADVNARATIDAEGFGGHTPLFNSVVNGSRRDSVATQALLDRGADREVRVNVRKFLDWCENPRWHEARNVTAAEWGHGFPEKDWVNAEALRVLEER